MPNSVLSSFTLPSGTTYDLKDAYARERIEALSKYTEFLGVTTTALTDGSTTNPITINSESVTAKKGDIVSYQSAEFVWNGTAWQEFGDLGALGDLAYVDSAEGSYTPAGSVAAPAISVATAGSTTTVNSITDVGTLPSWGCTVSGETLTFTWSQGSLPQKGSDTTVKTGDASYTASAPAFTGTQATITVTPTTP